jgi:hypothetical protein
MFSQLAVDTYNERVIGNENKITPYSSSNHNKKRFDPLMIEIVKELGEKADDFASHFVIVNILEEYKEYVRILGDIDHIRLEYDWKTYKLDKITKISQSAMDDALKLTQIDQIIKKPIPRF